MLLFTGIFLSFVDQWIFLKQVPNTDKQILKRESTTKLIEQSPSSLKEGGGTIMFYIMQDFLIKLVLD